MSAVSGSRARWAVLAVVLAPLVASAASADESSPSRPTAAAWYPIGVGTVTAATYPADTLHVGAALGQETDRTYLRFEVPTLPGDAEPHVVTVTIPADPDAGTSTPEVAVLLGCAVPGGLDPEAPAPAEVDCDGAPEAVFVAGDAPEFTLALPAPRGDVVDVALVAGGGDTWHVGFDRDAPTAVVSYEVAAPAAATTVASRPAAVTPVPGGPIALPPVTNPPPAAAGPPVAGDAAEPPPTVVAAAPASTTSAFRYAAVFALPLALLVVVAILGDGLTRPVRLREDAT